MGGLVTLVHLSAIVFSSHLNYQKINLQTVPGSGVGHAKGGLGRAQISSCPQVGKLERRSKKWLIK